MPSLEVSHSTPSTDQPPTTADLESPFTPEQLLQLRIGKVKPFRDQPYTSGIFKTAQKHPIQVHTHGLTGDERSYGRHKRPENALLHYCARHYASWRRELPQSAHLFTPGAFGENLVSVSANERNMCIGDMVAMGEEVLAEVTMPRQPCYKLNHRFELKDMSRRAQTLFRTGWYYRIIREGAIKAGDEIRVVERRHPEWTVARVQELLYFDRENWGAMTELVALRELSDEIRSLMQNRLTKGVENQDGRLLGEEGWVNKTWSQFRIVEKRRETATVTSFILEAVEAVGDPEPVKPGSHVRLKLGGKLVRAYSVVAGNANRFELGIALELQSRGGSRFLHEQTKEGDVLTAGKITASFPLSEKADHHIIIAGGIGITAFIAALRALEEKAQSYELHFAVSSEVPFQRYVDVLGTKAKIYNKAKNQRLDLNQTLSRTNDSTHIYCCGPQRLMDGVASTATRLSIPTENVHFEAFTVETSGDPFTAELVASKKTVEVPANKNLLDVLRETGFDIDSSCEVGNCGTCRVEVCSGRVEHRGTGLLEQEKCVAMLSCVSRGVGKIELDL